MEKAIILLSGGLDSATALYYAKKLGVKLVALIFDYSQRHRKEIGYARKIARLNKIPCRIVTVDLSWVQSSLTDKHLSVPMKRNLDHKTIPITYVAGRNILFLSYAFSLAESIGVKSIIIGAHIQDYSGYPDCRQKFLKAFQKAVNKGMKHGDIKIIAPLIKKSKKEIIKLGLRLGVPFDKTWSCYQGGRKPCLKCDSCRFRINAFKELGMTDPLLRRLSQIKTT
jgi:7-cyano-7-deazaguanine synthase